MGGCTSSRAMQNAVSGGSVEETPQQIERGRRRLSLSKSAATGSPANEEPRGHVAKATLQAHVLSFFPTSNRKMSIAGAPCKMLQRGFENKVVDQMEHPEKISWADHGIGYACKKGLKPENPNQDDFCILKVDDWAMYGVFDGHGPHGHDVSHYVQTHLPKLICSDPLLTTDTEQCLRNNFLYVNSLLQKETTLKKVDCMLSGCTCTIAIHRDNKVIVAHVGDSRAIMVTNAPEKGYNRVSCVELTQDHKPNLDVEKARIEAAGGQVRRLEGDIPHRVFLKGKHFPGLAMSRALGDLIGTRAGIIAEPDVKVYDLDQSRDLYLILCSDGVWEFVSNQEAAEMIHKRLLKHGVQDAAETLAQESWRRWISEEGNVVDDITVEIACLFPGEAKENIDEIKPAKNTKITI